MNFLRSFLIVLLTSAAALNIYSQSSIPLEPLKFSNNVKHITNTGSRHIFADTNKSTRTTRKFSAGGIFLNLGTGLNVPLRSFNDNSKPTFGILGRLEYSSTAIFPFVIGGEITYFSYIPDGQFKTLNLLSTYRTKIVSIGLNIEYSLTRFFNTPYSIPFITLDVKTNSIKRDIDNGRTLDGLPAKDSKISIGAGIGTTLFIFDFYIKYNYMKELSNFGAYAKVRFPVIRF